MASALSTYAFINAKLRARISKLLDEEFFRTVARARTFVEAIGLLAGTPYGAATDVYSRTGDVKLAELELVRVERHTLGKLGRYIPPGIEAFVASVLAEYEVSTLKQSLRLWFERSIRGRSIDDKVAYLLRDEGAHGVAIDAVINAGSTAEVEESLKGRPYAHVVRDGLDEVAELGSLFLVEVGLDRWYHAQLVAAARSLDGRDAEVALRLIGIQIDIRNVNWIVRMKRYYKADRFDPTQSILSGGHLLATDSLVEAYRSDRPIDPLLGALGSRYSVISGDRADEAHGAERLALLEELLRSVLFEEIRRSLGGYPFSIGTILAYVLLVQNEIRLLLTVLNARYYDLAAERIEELL